MQDAFSRILLIEDNPGHARLFRELLAEAGIGRYVVDHVESLLPGLTKLERDNHYSLILLDLSLPDSRGLETVRKVQEVVPQTAIIVLTGLDDEELGIEVIRIGAQDYLIKSQIDARLLSRAIGYAVERKRAQEGLRQAHHELENRVRERTAALSQANEQLLNQIRQRERVEEVLRETNALLEKLFNSAHLAVAYMDTGFTYLRVNIAYAAEHDQVPDDYVGRNHFDLFPDEAMKTIFRNVLDTDLPHVAYGQPIHFMPRKSQDESYWDWSLQPVKDSHGHTEGLLLSLINVTKRKLAEQQARRHQAELAHVSRLSTLGEMTSALAHELNQPLCAIMTATQACLRMLKAPETMLPDVQEAMEQVAAQAKRAGAILQHLRDFSRKRETQRMRLELNDIVSSACRFVSAEARPSGIDMRFRLSERPDPILGDPIQLEQVIVNLVRNAFEAMEEVPEQERQLEIITRQNDAQSLEVIIRDHGRGLPPDSQERIFEPFFSSKPQGMGIGLTISRSIIEAHGGRLWTVPNTGQGTTFHFTIPTMNTKAAG